MIKQVFIGIFSVLISQSAFSEPSQINSEYKDSLSFSNERKQGPEDLIKESYDHVAELLQNQVRDTSISICKTQSEEQCDKIITKLKETILNPPQQNINCTDEGLSNDSYCRYINNNINLIIDLSTEKYLSKLNN